MDITKKFYILLTGGTICKTYDPKTQKLENIPNKNYNILDDLKLPYSDVEIIELMCKDSKDINDIDKQIIINKINSLQSENCFIIVLHGTDCLVNIAQYCKNNIKSKIPIIFSGSMVPLQCKNTDGIQNIIESLIIIQHISPDVYISFHSRLFDVNNIEKNYDLLRFQSKYIY